MDDVRITPTSEEHIEGFHRCVDLVARERRYLTFVVGPALAQSAAYVRMLLAGGGIQFVALDATGAVVGWCDVVRDARPGFEHAWRFGMGLLPDARGRGVGRRLARATIDAALARGAERIELDVFASNGRAIRLYERLGFTREGVQRRARKLDGVYDDNVVMAYLAEPPTAPAVGPATGERQLSGREHG